MSLTSVEELTIREARADDWPAILVAQSRMEERMGVPAGSLDLPPMEVEKELEDGSQKMVRNPAVFYWVVERAGEVVEAFYLELAMEWSLVGIDPVALRAISEYREQVFEMASRAGARFVHAFVSPGSWEKANGRHLEKARLFPTGLVHHRRSIIAERIQP